MFKKIIHKIIFGIMWLCLLVSSFLIYEQIGGRGYTILIAAPKQGHLQANIVEQHNNDIPLTYQTSKTTTITVEGWHHHATIIGTNHTFADVMRYFRINGDFFNEEDLQYFHRVAVLNINAATAIFGDRRARGNIFYFEGEQFEVIGVIDDRDSTYINIYMPFTSIPNEGEIDSIAVDAGISLFFNQPEALALLQDLNISEEDYYKINMFAIHRIIEMYHELVVTLFILVIFESITSNAVKLALKHWRKIAKHNEEELDIWKVIFSKSSFVLFAAAAVIIVIFVIIGRESAGVFLDILDIFNTQNPFAAIPETIFMRHIQELAVWYFWIIVVFWISLITFVTYYVISFWRALAS